jgi:hypothetical protein
MSKRRKVTIAAVIAAVVVLLGAAAFALTPKRENLPAPSTAFCVAARKYDKKIATLTGKDKFTTEIELWTPMAAHAPKDVKQDANVFLDALERRAAGDKSVAKDPKIGQALQNVNRRAAQGCEFYQGDGTSGI